MIKIIQILIKSTFALIWIIIFYELLSNTSIRDQLFVFCAHNELLAPFLLILIQVLLATFALPCSPLTVLAGALWGWRLGIFYSILATVVSSFWTFLVGRYILKSWLHGKRFEEWWLRISQLIERFGWKASMVAFANPILPGSSLGYIFGASSISFKSFFLGVFLGTLPLQLIIVAIGSSAGDMAIGIKLKSLFILIVFLIGALLYKAGIPYFLERISNSSPKAD
jgi:uncharacterized membrane protein YdjX (TVP38/TMEM64 family)